MPFPGADQQNLSYRVEIDRSSLSDTVAMIREAVGQAMTEAVQSVAGASGQVMDATAVATSRVQGLRSVVDGATAGLTSPDAVTDQAKRGSATMSLMQAIAVRAGLSEPGFSTTRNQMSAAASMRMSQFSSGVDETILGVTNGAQSVLGIIGGVASAVALFPPAAPVAGLVATGAMVAEGAIGLATVGFERTIERERTERYLSKYGKGTAREMTRAFEERVRSLGGVDFEEASAIGRSALMNLGTQNMTAREAGQAMFDAIGDWKAAGKLLGADRSEALAITGELYRMGIRPGENVRSLFASSAAASQSTGMNAMALSQMGMQFGAESAARGYDLLSSNMQFQLQAGTIGEAIRAGSMSRATLTTIAGTTGPLPDQVIAATQNYLAEGRRFSMGTGFGQMASMNVLAGGRGAAGMSMQDLLSAPARMAQVDPTKVLGAAASQVATNLKSLGVQVTGDTLVSGLMNMGMNESAARMQAHMFLNPEEVSIQRARAAITGQETYAESMDVAGGPTRLWRKLQSGIADTWRENITEGDSKMLWAATGNVGMSGMTLLAERVTGSKYRGFGGAITAAGDLMDASLGEGLREIGDLFAWDENPNSAWYARDVAAARGKGATRLQILTQGEIKGMSSERFRDSLRAFTEKRQWMAKNYGMTDTKAVTAEMLKDADRVIGNWIDDNAGAVSGLQNTLKQKTSGMDWSKDKVKRVLSTGASAKLKFAQAKPGSKEAEQAIDDMADELMLDPSLGLESREQARAVAQETLAGSAMSSFREEDLQTIATARADSGVQQAMSAALEDDDTKKSLANRLFKKDSAGAREFMKLKDTKGLDRFTKEAVEMGYVSQATKDRAKKAGVSITEQVQREVAMAGAPLDLKKKEAAAAAAAPKAKTDAGADSASGDVKQLVQRMDRLITVLENK